MALEEKPPEEMTRKSRLAELWPVRGLSGKLLVLTITFVMVAEVLIYVPSIANFRNMWLDEKLEAASIAALAASSPGATPFPEDLQKRLLQAIGMEAIAMMENGQHILIAAGNMPEEVAVHQDLRELGPAEAIAAAFGTLFLGGGDRLIRVSGEPPAGMAMFEIVLREDGLRQAMLRYSRNILLLSMAISVITASFVYLALRRMIVRPIQKLAASMQDFSADPEDVRCEVTPTGRHDEIGRAEERFAEMQAALRDMLHQRRHLANLGLAVSKINHDLRNILASAQLFSDHLGEAQDPLVRRIAPKLVGTIDRAIGYTRSVLAYGRAEEAEPVRRLVSARRLVEEVAEILSLTPDGTVVFENRVPGDLEIDADPDQFFRVMLNLCRNAQEALVSDENASVIRRLWVEGERTGAVARLRVCDTGPGLPKRAREALFEPFQGSTRPGGVGLGLAIAQEIVAAHGGEIALLERAGAGTVFQIEIPDRPARLADMRDRRKA
ncbi:sensor histidine kinase [Afifella marina]|uniref:histidine kinase n=1 Tax=Afifella marina DSM 2698 TaxID=1120955 RepID=A0A1G5N9U6_AFIMA|nr:HAMP domain-containing sensor histidine kinase [Afifella marina]SCZ34187.1 Signal transduction histidine kinase [Afifella marina DSM 2698]